MKTIPELVEATKQHEERRHLPTSQVGTIRVDLEHREQKTLDATYKSDFGEFQFVIDEPALRGGLNLAPPPLGYFVTGAGA